MPKGIKGFVKGKCGNPNANGTAIAKKRYFDTMEELEKQNFNPVERLVRMAKNEALEYDEKTALKATITLVERTTQTFKSIEHKTDDKQHSEILDMLGGVMNPLIEEHKRDY